MIRAILSTEKRFDRRWIGSPALNRAGLHGARMTLANGCAAMRRVRSGTRGGAACDALTRDGFVVVPNLLPEDEFRALREEVRAALAAAARATPYPQNALPGFQPRTEAAWGFDRFDGGTLNRFLTISADAPRAAAFARHALLGRLSRTITGRDFPPARMWLYETIQGDERANPDPQKTLHRDTFHAAMKFWFFVDPVEPAQGPFVYVPGSHRLTARRRAWEAARATRAAATRRDADDVDGSFRIDDAELAALGLPPPVSVTVAANTLIMANVFGFHRRGDAEPGTRRLALYGNNRPHPFKLAGN